MILKVANKLMFAALALLLIFPSLCLGDSIHNQCRIPTIKKVSAPINPSFIEDCDNLNRVQPIPKLKDSKQVIGGCYYWKPTHVAKMIDRFIKEYSESFSVKEEELRRSLSGTIILWSDLEKQVTAYDTSGNLIKDVYVTGLTLDRDRIWVVVRTRFICESSLAHELVHLILWRNGVKRGDADHEGDRWVGWTKKHTIFLRKLQIKMCETEGLY